ncbi:MAG TPA: hemerythrin domain-containing protein [Methylomirabilota bacterium]|nr:hemerythrin domain-containing protein [Methylomirabilota bacterium]
MDAIQFLKQEHKKAKAGLKKVLKASPDTRGDLWNELQPELEAHEQIEDACLYGPLARGAGKVDAKLAAWRAKHQKEVERVEGLVGQLENLDPAEAAWIAKVRAIGTSLEKHIREEEQDIFPRIGKVWDRKQLAEAGAEMKEMKAEKLHA